ncbi:MAG: hypothetical protein ACI4Q3_07060 [Kiritimatiellia bacterium]
MKTMKVFLASMLVGVLNAALAATTPVYNWDKFASVIASANDGDTIELNADLTWGTSDLTISKSVTISGLGRYTITRGSGSSAYGFKLDAGATLTLSEITLDGSSLSDQSAMFTLASGTTLIFDDGATLTNVKTATGSSPVVVAAGATLTLRAGATISSCAASQNGGAIDNAGTVELAGGTISGCTAAQGGAIHSSGTLTMTAGSISGCTGTVRGGAIHSSGTLTLTAGTITDCTAAQGGAIYSYSGETGTASISGVTVSACQATGDYGGAIYNAGTMSLSAATITGCTAVTAGGGIYTTGTLNLSGELNVTGNLVAEAANNICPSAATLITQTGDLTGTVGVTFEPTAGKSFGVWSSGTGTAFFVNDSESTLVGEATGSVLVWRDTQAVLYPDGEKTWSEVTATALAGAGCVTIVADVSADLAVPDGLTIDLNGHKITGTVTAQGHVTITDSSAGLTGEVTTALAVSEEGCSFTLEYGTYATEPLAAYLAEDRVVLANADGTFSVTMLVDSDETTTLAIDTRKGAVRVVNDPETDLLPLTYSAADFVASDDEAAAGTARIAATPVTTTGEIACWYAGTDTADSAASGDGSFDYAPASTFAATENGQLLCAQTGEAEFTWQETCYGLIQLVHTNGAEEASAVAYFKFPDPQFNVLQRSSVTNEYEILVSETALASLGYSRIGKLNEADVENRFNTFEANKLRLWENLVTGADSSKAYAGDVDSVATAQAKATLRMPGAASGDASYGYRVFYQLRKAADDWEAASEIVAGNQGIELPLNESATGLYRLYTLIVPVSNPAITNEIPAVNILGVLRVASSQTNTMVAVPWRALASDPSAAVDVAVSNYVRTASLDAGDTFLALDSATGNYEAWDLADSGHWQKALTVTGAEVVEASEPDARTLARGQGFWLVRKNPLDENEAARPFYLVGQFGPEDVTTTVAGGTSDAPGYTMLGLPGIASVKINDLPWGENPLANDVLTVPVEGRKAPLALTWRDGQWGYSKVAYDSEVGAIVTTRVTDVEVPAGTAFWYARRGAAFSFTWPLDWPKAVK